MHGHPNSHSLRTNLEGSFPKGFTKTIGLRGTQKDGEFDQLLCGRPGKKYGGLGGGEFIQQRALERGREGITNFLYVGNDKD